MKVKLITLSSLAAAVLLLAAWAPRTMTFEPNGKIWVDGTSTVQSWTCEVGQYSGSVTGDVDAGTLKGISATTLTVPIAQMDCGGRQITGKMRDALKASNHPNIQFSLTSASVGAPNDGGFAVDTRGKLTIAGTTRDVRFVASGKVLADGRYRLTGSVPVVMSHFGVSPPTAMLGALRSGDDVTVGFDVVISG